MKIEFEHIYHITIPYGVVGIRNGSMRCFKDEIRDEIMEFIKERVKDENFR